MPTEGSGGASQGTPDPPGPGPWQGPTERPSGNSCCIVSSSGECSRLAWTNFVNQSSLDLCKIGNIAAWLVVCAATCLKAYRQGSAPPKKPKMIIKKEKTDIEKTVDDVKHAGQLAYKFVNDGIVMLEESKEPLPKGFVEVSPRGSLQAAAP